MSHKLSSLEIIDRLPFELAARLAADEFFCDIPVVVAELGNVKLEIEKKQAVLAVKNNKRGVAAVVLQLVADDLTTIPLGPLTLLPSIQIVEQVVMNRDDNGTKKSCRMVARRIRDILKGSGLVGMVTAMKPRKPYMVPVTNAMDVGANVVVYEVAFECEEQAGSIQQQVAMPQLELIEGPPAQCSISCATPGANIFYTLDDSYPSEQNEKASVYSNPIDIPPAGLTVRACAYMQGMIASWVARETITPQ